MTGRDKHLYWAVKTDGGYTWMIKKTRSHCILMFRRYRPEKERWRWYYNRGYRCVKVYVYDEPQEKRLPPNRWPQYTKEEAEE